MGELSPVLTSTAQGSTDIPGDKYQAQGWRSRPCGGWSGGREQDGNQPRGRGWGEGSALNPGRADGSGRV